MFVVIALGRLRAGGVLAERSGTRVVRLDRAWVSPSDSLIPHWHLYAHAAAMFRPGFVRRGHYGKVWVDGATVAFAGTGAPSSKRFFGVISALMACVQMR